MRLDDNSLDQLFRDARSQNGWLSKDVPTELLTELYGVMCFGPTCANTNPARLLFLKSDESKQRLAPLVTEGNRDKVLTAPVVTIIGHDLEFHRHMPRLFAHNPAMQDKYAADAELAEVTAFRNGTLQGAYLMLAARALGLDCGPMSGFSNHDVDTEFFAGTSVKSNFICGLGYGDSEKLFGRLPRLEFNEVCEVI